RALGASRHRAQIVVIADAGENEILIPSRLGRGRRKLAAMLRNPFLGGSLGAVVDRDVMAALVLQVRRHRVSHHAKTKKCHRCHSLPSCMGMRIAADGLCHAPDSSSCPAVLTFSASG